MARPKNPAPPQSAGEVRQLISIETVRKNPSDRRLKYLYRLLKVFVAAEDAAREDLKNRLLEQANHLKAAELAAKKREYQLRFVSRPLGQRTLLLHCEKLAARVAELERSAVEVGVKSEETRSYAL